MLFVWSAVLIAGTYIICFSKLGFYLQACIQLGHSHARHLVYHKGCESWEMIKFYDDVKDESFFHSEHQISCSRCDHSLVAKRAWFKGDGWCGLSRSFEDSKMEASMINEENN